MEIMMFGISFMASIIGICLGMFLILTFRYVPAMIFNYFKSTNAIFWSFVVLFIFILFLVKIIAISVDDSSLTLEIAFLSLGFNILHGVISWINDNRNVIFSITKINNEDKTDE